MSIYYISIKNYLTVFNHFLRSKSCQYLPLILKSDKRYEAHILCGVARIAKRQKQLGYLYYPFAFKNTRQVGGVVCER